MVVSRITPAKHYLEVYFDANAARKNFRPEILVGKSSGPVWWRQRTSLALSTWHFALEQLQTHRLRRPLGAGREAWGWVRRWAEGPGRQGPGTQRLASAGAYTWGQKTVKFARGPRAPVLARGFFSGEGGFVLPENRVHPAGWSMRVVPLSSLVLGVSALHLSRCAAWKAGKGACSLVVPAWGGGREPLLVQFFALGPHWQRKLFYLPFCAVIPRAFCSTVWLKFLHGLLNCLGGVFLPWQLLNCSFLLERPRLESTL